MALAAQLFLRLISSKQLSAHIHTHINGETRQCHSRGRKKLWSGQCNHSRKEVGKQRPELHNSAVLKLIYTFLSIWPFVQTTRVTRRLWIVYQDHDPFPHFLHRCSCFLSKTGCCVFDLSPFCQLRSVLCQDIPTLLKYSFFSYKCEKCRWHLYCQC